MTDLAQTLIHWFPMDMPPMVERGCEQRFLVAWRDGDMLSSSEAHYLNDMPLDFGEDEGDLRGLQRYRGWCDRIASADGKVVFQPLDDQFVTYLGWTAMPSFGACSFTDALGSHQGADGAAQVDAAPDDDALDAMRRRAESAEAELRSMLHGAEMIREALWAAGESFGYLEACMFGADQHFRRHDPPPGDELPTNDDERPF